MCIRDRDGDGLGIVEMLDNEPDVGSDPDVFYNGVDTIKTNGRGLTIAGAGLVLGNIDTSAGLPVFSGGELLKAIDVNEGGPIPPGVEDKSGLISWEDVDRSSPGVDDEGGYYHGKITIDGQSYEEPLIWMLVAISLHNTSIPAPYPDQATQEMEETQH